MTRKNIIIISILCFALGFTSCEDYLTAPSPATDTAEDFFSNGQACINNINADYVPLQWEYGTTYCAEWFIGDIVSDDALKGGQNLNDMSNAYDFENWKTISNNDLLNDIYRANYLGIGRCNLSLKYIPTVATDSIMDEKTKNRLIGEAHFLRALYYFRLIRIFGGVPLTLDVINGTEGWRMERASVDDVFKAIIADLEEANRTLWIRSKYPAADLGRATKGAAQAMLLKTYLYMAGEYWNPQVSMSSNECYKAAQAWGDSIISSGEYSLITDYSELFSLAGENGVESVFEVQYMEEETSDYGADAGGFGATRGTFSVILTRSRSSLLGGGWGFNKPTQNLYDEFESGDPRRDATILNPLDSLIENPNEEIYLGCRYVNRKRALYLNETGTQYERLGHATRGEINNTIIRYADVLLMHAEACIGAGDEGAARSDLNQLRTARGMATYPGYSFNVNGTTITNPSLLQAIRHERRVELAMEGHRWFDIVRWNGLDGTGVKVHMDAYKETENAKAQEQMAAFVAGKHELFPIPFKQRELNGLLGQNPGY
ncbi:MAG: RagB/SusD family nutrient uptake outer membrane protein [Paludibacteraceae bacterium]|nr:RagB/SusD family nutrient uptake outer membrane protein [Paludibacteraceae bacterium]